MQLAYSTYALQTEDPFEAVERVAAIGFEGLELNVGDDWPTAPHKLDAAARERLCERYQAVGFPSPVLMNLIGLCGKGEDGQAKGRVLDASCALAADLDFDATRRVVTTTLGGQGGDSWEASKERVAAALIPYAEIAEAHGVTLAIEPHAGQEMDTPEKAVWLVERLERPSVRLNFDHSHFQVLNLDLGYCVRTCAPYSVHTHIKDGRLLDGQVQYRLPGEGDLDLADYYRAVAAAGLDLPITAEVTGQIWKRDDYDPWATAQRCYELMRDGLERSGVLAAPAPDAAT